MGLIYKTKYVRVPLNGQHAKPMRALMSNAISGETMEFDTAEDVSAYVTLKLQDGHQYVGKEEHDDGTFTLYFAVEQPRDSIFG